MLRLRFMLVCLLICACSIPFRIAASSDPLLQGEPYSVPLPAGREMSDVELLDVEGELGFLLTLLIVAASSAVGAGGATAVHENWFDEDYGIDRDDWGNIGLAAGVTFSGVMCGGTANHALSCFGS